MGKGRLEAFSDGVLAIIITIMVLELRPPHATDLSALRPLTPVLLSYVLSFVYIGIYWNNHHHMLHATRQVTGSVLWANLHLLFWLSLVPFATAWLGENHQAAAPTAIYGVVLIMAAMAYTLLQRQILKAEEPHSILATAVGRDTKGKLSLVLYASAIGAAFVYPSIADGLYVLVALIWLIPDRRIERALVHEGPAAQARSGNAAILAILSLSSGGPRYPTPSDPSPQPTHLLYATEKTSISVYDIDRGHRFLR